MSEMLGAVSNIPTMSVAVHKAGTVSGNLGSPVINVGEDGATFVPFVDENGTISWTNDSGLQNPTPRNIRGPKGDPGEPGLSMFYTDKSLKTGATNITADTNLAVDQIVTKGRIIQLGDFVLGSNNILGQVTRLAMVTDGVPSMVTVQSLLRIKGDKPVKGEDYDDGEPGRNGFSIFYTAQNLGVVGETTWLLEEDISTQGRDIQFGDLVLGANGMLGCVAYGSASTDNEPPSLGVETIMEVKGKQGSPGVPGYTPQKGVDYFDGEDGASVTVASVSESTADGGSNVVTFSDGKTLTVKNGSKGSTGTAGKDGATGAAGANGFATFYTAYELTPAGGDDFGAANLISIDSIETNGREIQVGDFVIGSNGVLGRVDSMGGLGGYNDGNVQVTSLVNMRGNIESWTFTLEDGSTVTKAVYVG